MTRAARGGGPDFGRRAFLKGAGGAAAAAVAAPLVLPGRLLGAAAPSNRIAIGCIGVGRMGMGDLQDVIGLEGVQIIAVCDLDANRLAFARKTVESYYAAHSPGGSYRGCAALGDFREVIARPDIDAVMVVTPDHWHALPAIAAAKAGKDIFIQKPLTLTIPEGRVLSDAVGRHGVVLQVGSQHRSSSTFRFGCELVRNGRIGRVHMVTVGFEADPFGNPVAPTEPPKELDYDFWLGPAPQVPYVEDRVHPRKGYGRPGWLRTDDYCCGMITGWGSHYMDIAQWGLGLERGGPVAAQAQAQYAKEGPWDVHGQFRIEYTYPGGVKVICADTGKVKPGIEFIGTAGRVHVNPGVVDAEPRELLKSRIAPDEVHLYRSNSHKGNWLECIRGRRETVAPAEIGHRSASACIVGYIAMCLPGRLLRWDVAAERFIGDEDANRLLSRPMRSPWRL